VIYVHSACTARAPKLHPRGQNIRVPAQRVAGAVGDHGAGHEGGRVGQLHVGLALADPCVEVAVGLRFAVHEVVAKLGD